MEVVPSGSIGDGYSVGTGMGILCHEVYPGQSFGLLENYSYMVGCVESLGHRGRCRGIVAMV